MLIPRVVGPGVENDLPQETSSAPSEALVRVFEVYCCDLVGGVVHGQEDSSNNSELLDENPAGKLAFALVRHLDGNDIGENEGGLLSETENDRVVVLLVADSR